MNYLKRALLLIAQSQGEFREAVYMLESLMDKGYNFSDAAYEAAMQTGIAYEDIIGAYESNKY